MERKVLAEIVRLKRNDEKGALALAKKLLDKKILSGEAIKTLANLQDDEEAFIDKVNELISQKG